MKITILQGYALPVPPVLGGAVEKRWYILGQKFAERGNSVVHISRKWKEFPETEVIRNVVHRRITGFAFSKNNLLSKTWDALYTLAAIFKIPLDTDIIITNTFWAPIIVPLFRKAKIYVNVARMPKGQMRFYKFATRLHAPSTAVANAIIRELPKDRCHQVIMIPNTLPYEISAPIVLDKKEPLILYCGRIHPEKGLELLTQIAKSLPRGWSIKIVGPWKESQGGGGNDYFQSLKEMFCGTPVEFTGPIFGHKDLIELYMRASIFVYPSIADQGEAFGLAPLEAMSFGCVPVASDLACFKDFIFHRKNGMIFNHIAEAGGEELSECINELIKNDNLRKMLATQALEVRNSHSADRIADLFLEDFKEIKNTLL